MPASNFEHFFFVDLSVENLDGEGSELDEKDERLRVAGEEIRSLTKARDKAKATLAQY